jgi:hypothetical protein
MLPPTALSRSVDSKLAPPTPLGVTPKSPGFSSNVPTNVSVDVLAKWPETVAMMISNSTSPETSAALTAIGDQLGANHWIEAAHVWYGLTPPLWLNCGLLHTRFQLFIVSADLPVWWTRILHDPFGSCWVCQPGYHPDLQQGSRFHDPF